MKYDMGVKGGSKIHNRFSLKVKQYTTKSKNQKCNCLSILELTSAAKFGVQIFPKCFYLMFPM